MVMNTSESKKVRWDELCTCGHYKSDHKGIDGHGFCSKIECDCAQFTWAETINIDPDIIDFIKMNKGSVSKTFLKLHGYKY